MTATGKDVIFAWVGKMVGCHNCFSVWDMDWWAENVDYHVNTWTAAGVDFCPKCNPDVAKKLKGFLNENEIIDRKKNRGIGGENGGI